MAEGKKEATHSLTTEIQMLFEAQGTNKVQGDIDAISNKVTKMVEPMQALTKAFEELNDSPVKNLVKTLNNFSLDSTEVNADNLRTVLEDKIATAITKSKIKFIGDKNPERYPFEVRMGDKFWKKNQKNITEAMAESFSNFEVNTKDIPPLDNREILKEFQTKFNEQIVELIKDEDIFSLYRKDAKKGIKKYKYKRKFQLDENAVDEIMGAIEGQFINVLSDPNNIELDEIPKLRISSVKLKQAMIKIQESIGDVDDLLGVDPDVLKDLPNIEEKLLTFRENLDKMIREINLLATQLESITFGKATEKDVKNSIKVIQDLKDSVILQLDGWIKDITIEIEKDFNIRPNLDKFKESITSLNTFFDTVFQSQLDQFKEDVNKVLANLETKEVDGGEGKDLLKGKKIDITQSIIDILMENLLNQDIPIELDMGLIDETILQWSSDFNVVLNEDLQGLTNVILKEITDTFEGLIASSEMIIANFDKEITTVLSENNVIIAKEDVDTLNNILREELGSYIKNILNNIVLSGFKDDTIDLELPDSFKRDIKQIVDKNIREYSRRIIENYKSEEFDGAGVNESIERLNKQTTMITNAVIREVNQILTDIRKEFLHKDSGWAESTKNLKSIFDKNIRSLTTSYIKALEDSINTIIITEDSMDNIQEQISKQVIENINNTQVTTLGSSTKMDLSYENWVDKVRETFEEAIKKWSPHITLNEMVDGAKLSNIINKKIMESVQSGIDIWSQNLYEKTVPETVTKENTKKNYKVKSYTYEQMLIEDSHGGQDPIYRKPEWDRDGKWSYAFNDAVKGTDFLIDPVEYMGRIDMTKLISEVSKAVEEALWDGINTSLESFQNIDQYQGNITPSLDLKTIMDKIDKSITNAVVYRLENMPLEDVVQGDSSGEMDGAGLQKEIKKQVDIIVENTIKQLESINYLEIELDEEYKKLLTKIATCIDNEITKWAPPSGSFYEIMQREGTVEKFFKEIQEIIDFELNWYLAGLKNTHMYGKMAYDNWGKEYTVTNVLEGAITLVDDEMNKYVAVLDEKLSTENEWAHTLFNKEGNIRTVYTDPLDNLYDEVDTTELVNTIKAEIHRIIQEQVDLAIKEIQGKEISIDGEFKPISIDKLTSKIDPLIESAILNRIEQTTLNISGDESVEIDLTKSTKKALKEVEKVINDAIKRGTSKFTSGGEEEVIELDLKTKQLQKNINSLVQKIVNEKAKQVTAYGNSLVDIIELDTERFDKLKENIDNIVDSMLVSYEMAAENFEGDVFTEEDVNRVYTKLVNSFANSFTLLSDKLLEGIEGISTGDFSISSKKLHPKIKKALADSLDVSVGEFTKTFPVISGKEAQEVILRKNVELIVNAVNDVINNSVKGVVSSYEDTIRDLDIEPDGSLVDYIYDQLIKLQDSIVSKAKRMVRDQFKFLTEEIKAMNIDARSMGYKPTQAFSKEVMKANPALAEQVAGATSMKNLVKVLDNAVKNGEMKIETASLQGADVTAQELDIKGNEILVDNINKLTTNASSVIVDGKVVDLKVEDFPMNKIAAPIDNYLKNGYPFSVDPEITSHISSLLDDITPQHFLSSNVYKNGYNPLDINKIFFKHEAEPYEGLFKGITSNMAKYFMVGYMMRLPIKAITEANKVAAELDYHTAKAKQNILIKDPQMTNVARNLVYDKYKAEGKDVKSSEFKSDVNKEAASMRNIMKTEMPNYLLNIAKAYQQEISDVGRFYSIASRKSKNPYEALTKTREVAKISAAEEDLDTDFAATGLEALSSQWGVNIGELDRYTNMLLKTAMLSNTTVTDLLMAQRDTAAMFKSRLSGIDDEEAFATSMALSSMFVEATGKSGRESGTFWRNVLQRPYVKDSRKFLEEASKMKGFEDLDPYYTDEAGNRVQKDFLTMFSNILETAMKVDDPSAMTVLSEVFPIRTIGGAESVSALVDDLKIDLEKSIESLKKIGELDEDATLETVGVKEVVEKYIENIMNVTDEDIGMYIAGLQDTTQFAVKGLQTQWQSTVYSVFSEFKEENSAAMTYLTRVLSMFEDGAHKLSDVLSMFAKAGVGFLGESMFKRIKGKISEIPQSPTDIQKAMAEKYIQLQSSEKTHDLKRKAIEEGLGNYKQHMDEVYDDIDVLQDKRQQLHSFIIDKEGKKDLSYDEEYQLSRAYRQRDMYDDQIIKLRNTYNQLEKHVQRLSGDLAESEQAYNGTVELGRFLEGSMGAKSVDELRNSFANYIRNENIYTEIAPMAMRSKLQHSDEWYTQLHSRKSEIEQSLLNQQRELINRVNSSYTLTSPEDLEAILGEDYGDIFYAMEHRVSDETIEAMKKMVDHFGDDYVGMRKSFEKTYKELNMINSELIDLNTERLEIERAIFEAERPVVEGYAKVEGMSVPITKPKTTEQKIEGYREMLPALGIDVDEFEGGLDRLAAMFKDGRLDVDEYEDSLREVAVQLGITEDDFDSFKLSVKKLNNEIRQGKKEIYDYMTALELASTKSGKIKTKEVIESSEGKDTLETETQVKGEESGIGKEVVKTGVFASILKGIKGAGKATKTAKDVGTAAKLASKFKGIGTGILAGGKVALIGGGKIALLAAITDIIGSAIGGGLERGMTDSERLSLEADKLESVINKATGWRPNKEDNAVKRGLNTVIGTVLGGYTAGKNQLNKWLGGTAPSAKETWSIWKKSKSNPDATLEELRTQLKEEYEVGAKRGKANYEKQLEYLNKNPFVDPLTGQLRKNDDPLLQNLPLEDLMEFLDKRMKILNQQLTESDALFTKEKVQLLISGISNNSKEMRDAVKKHLDKNIIEMTRIVDELKEYLPKLVPGSDTHTAMWLQILDLENRIAESELQKFETDFSAYDEIMEKYSRESSKIQSKYDIKKYDALLSGIKKDSSAIKQIEKKMAEEQVRMIAGIQSRLDTLKQQFADKPEQRDKLLLQIQELEADKKRILADIKDKMSEGLSTFNLPSDIKPITYYEAMTRNNTHKNVTVAAGDAVVNVNIANMSGSDKDIDRLGRAVSDAVSKAQKNFVRQFANDVKSGMGNNYYSWNEY